MAPAAAPGLVIIDHNYLILAIESLAHWPEHDELGTDNTEILWNLFEFDLRDVDQVLISHFLYFA